ncbi:ankyrin repeat domain-containing protein SOWAHC-like [Epinephelus fuscoguttatus]|uniref:ankyrin repeat domain-containing protein SOWAHC-like n=1 Tax=Epinephelus fuscoguttatus TaxID=293821 RepID=UPI0020D15E11|nr:ankyrin repeat domain-containing protein SOWAHC-like [Epinephelus fuscoguttatus]
MEAHFPESSLDDELQRSKTEDVHSLQDLNQDTLQDPESLKQDLEQQSPHSSPDQVQGADRDHTEDEAENKKCDPDPQDHLEEQRVDKNPAGDGASASPQGLDRAEHQVHTGSDQDQDRMDCNQDQNQDQDLTPANEEASEESGGSVPALVITQAEEAVRPVSTAPVTPAETPVEPAEKAQRPTDLVIPVSPTEPSLSSSSDGGDMACSDLLSLRSDSLSLVSRTSEEDDIGSVAASSVMSLFHRVQLDPLEKHWLRSSALGNMAAQRQLLAQEPSLVLKKDFVSTALHWAAKQGCREAVDMMLQAGADVNVRSHVSEFLNHSSIRDLHQDEPSCHALSVNRALTNVSWREISSGVGVK